MQRKVAYVGAHEAELTIMVTQHDLSATIDLAIPQVPTFPIRVPFDHQPGGKTYMFHEMVTMLQAEMVKYLLAVGIPQELVDKTYYAMVKAVEGSEGGDDVKADRSGVGGDPLLERVVTLEPLEVFEVRWKLPDGLSEAIHQKIVTATQKVTLPSHGAHPGTFPMGHPPATLKQNYPSVRNLVQKFRGQQNKPLTGPVFVMVYDVNGRPVGVRSIKGPNWSWLKKATLLQRKQAAAASVSPDTLRVYEDPTADELRLLLEGGGSARAFLGPDGRKLYAWDAADAVHSEVLAHLPATTEWIPLVIFEDGEVEVTESSRRTRWWHNPLVTEVLLSSPALQRVLGSKPRGVSYYDEATSGDWATMPPAATPGVPDAH